MKSAFSRRVKFYLVALVLSVSMLCVLSGLANTASAQNNPPDLMEDLMDEIMGEIQDEINQEIKADVRRQTTETVAEEELSPSNTFSGVYIGLVNDEQVICSWTFSGTNVTGTCKSSSGDTVTISPTGGDGTIFDFLFAINGPDCSQSSGNTGKATLVSGTGEPGTTFIVVLDGTDCNDPENDAIFVKQ